MHYLHDEPDKSVENRHRVGRHNGEASQDILVDLVAYRSILYISNLGARDDSRSEEPRA